MIRLIFWLAVACTIWTGCSIQPQTPAYRAQRAFDQAEFGEAERDCSQGLATSPDDYQLLMLRGRSLAMLGRHDAAVEDFTRAIGVRPDDPEPLYRRQLSYRELGATELAERDDLAAKAIDPNFGAAFQYDPSTFIRQPPLITQRAGPRSASDEGEVDQERADHSAEVAFNDSRGDDSETDPSVESDGDQSVDESPSTDGAGRPVMGSTNPRRDGLTVIEPPQVVSHDPQDQTSEDPLTEEPEDDSEVEPAPSRPSISTVPPVLIPRGDITSPTVSAPARQLPTTGLNPYRSAPAAAGSMPGSNGSPITTGLPVTTGFPSARPYLPQSSLPGGSYSPFPQAQVPGAATTGILSRGAPYSMGPTSNNLPSPHPGTIPRRTTAVPGGTNGITALPGSGSRTSTLGTALPGTGPLNQSGPISTALPGSAPPLPKSPGASTALPSSGETPRR